MASVAKGQGLTAAQLAWYNPKVQRRKKTGALVVGQSLRIPTAAVVAAARDVPDPAIEIYGRAPAKRSRVVTHVVREGETLASIARRYGTTVKALQQRNRLKKALVVPGQRVVIRGGGTTTSPKGKPSATSKKKKATTSARKKKAR